MPPYWDVSAELDRILAPPPMSRWRKWTTPTPPNRDAIFTGSWAERDWRNVPGPFFTAETDTCGGGRFHASNLILVNEDWAEFVYRQPADSQQVVQLFDAANDDPFQAYGGDGDDHWTLEEVRLWWADRNRLLEWITSTIEQMSAESAAGEAASLREYAADIAGPLQARLQHYAYWLDNRRAAEPDDRLPSL